MDNTKLFEKTATALKSMKKELVNSLEKTASLEYKLKEMKNDQERLFKLAKQEMISYEDIPTMLEKLAGMDFDKKSLELAALEKAANSNFLLLGKVSTKTASVYGGYDPLTQLIYDNMGM